MKPACTAAFASKSFMRRPKSVRSAVVDNDGSKTSTVPASVYFNSPAQAQSESTATTIGISSLYTCLTTDDFDPAEKNPFWLNESLEILVKNPDTPAAVHLMALPTFEARPYTTVLRVTVVIAIEHQCRVVIYRQKAPIDGMHVRYSRPRGHQLRRGHSACALATLDSSSKVCCSGRRKA